MGTGEQLLIWLQECTQVQLIFERKIIWVWGGGQFLITLADFEFEGILEMASNPLCKATFLPYWAASIMQGETF